MSDQLATTDNGSRLHEIAVTRDAGATIATMADAWTLAQAFFKAGMAPSSFKSSQQVMIALMAGAEIGMGATASLKNLMVVNGTPSLHSDGPMALCLRSGMVGGRKDGYTGKPFDDDYTAWFEVKRKGIEGWTRREFSVADAKTAQLWGKSGPWKNFPKRMLFVRARAFALRDAFPDVLGGVGIAEELQDIPEAANDGHESRSDAMLAALEENEPVDVEHRPADHEAGDGDSQPEEPSTGETQSDANEAQSEPQSDLPQEPTQDEIDEIRAREAEEARLFEERGDG